MTVERFYIYRCGSSDACALTQKKDYSSLPVAPDRWRFWMQIGRLQAQDGRYGFKLEAALTEIAAAGYSLFAGSPKLLGHPPVRVAEEGPHNV